MERVDLEPAARHVRGEVPSSLGGPRPRETLERSGKIPPVGLPLCRLPLIERLAVPEREALHERPAIPGQGLVEGDDARGAGLRRWVAMAPRPRQRRPEVRKVGIDRTFLQGDGRAIDDQASVSEPRTEDRERAPKRIAGIRPIRLRPEQRCQPFTACRTTDHRQIS